jgi:putative beta-barrel porin MtrB/PioB
VALYNSQVASAAPTFNTWTNSAMSPQKSEAKVEANYHLPWYHLQLIGGARIEHEDFGTWTETDAAGGITGLRQKVDTVGYRVELRKTMSDVFTGSVAWISERRDGASPWLKPRSLPLTGVFPASQDCVSVGANACIYNQNGEFAFHQENLQRDKVRLYGTWNAMDRLSLVGVVDLGTDQFRGPTLQGLRETTMYNISLDADYQLSDIWRLRAYVTSNRRTYDMGRSSDYDLKMTDRSTTVGLGFSGTPFAQLKVGGDLIWMDDRLKYDLTPDANASAANIALLATTGGLPDVKYELTRLNLYGEYNINKTSQVRLDYIYYRSFFNEWTYVNNGIPFLFSDNTTLGADQRQTVNFLGVRYVYKFQ